MTPVIISSPRSLESFKRIESPFSAINNLINQITERLEIIYFDSIKKNSAFINKLIFEDKSLTIAGCIKISVQNEGVSFKFNGNFDNKKLKLIQKTIDHQNEIISLFQQYVYTVSSTSRNIDDSISHSFVECLYSDLTNKYIDNSRIFILPYKTKIQHLYDNDKTLEALFNRYSYVGKFCRVGCNSNNGVSFKLMRVLSSELDEVKSLENLRFEDVEILKEEVIPTERLNKFLVELFYYGEICN